MNKLHADLLQMQRALDSLLAAQNSLRKVSTVAQVDAALRFNDEVNRIRLALDNYLDQNGGN